MRKAMPEIVQSPIKFDDEWRVKSECRGADPQQFFPDYEGTNWLIRQRQLEKVREKYCNYCPVINHCAKYAIMSAQEFGIWGGMSETELKKHVKKYETNQALPSFIVE